MENFVKKLKHLPLREIGWSFTAFFAFCSWQLCHWIILCFSGIFLLVFGLCIADEFSEETIKVKSDKILVVAMIVALSLFMYGAFGFFWMLGAQIVYFVLVYFLLDDDNMKTGLMTVILILTLGFGSVDIFGGREGSLYRKSLEKYDSYMSAVSESNYISAQNKQRLNNCFWTSKSVWDECNQLEIDSCRYYQQQTSKLQSDFVAKARDRQQKLTDRYVGKVERLRVKRLWFGDRTQPWTYQGYGRFSLQVGTTGGLFSSRTLTRLDVNYKGIAVGSQNFSYVNVVFSDNSFCQFDLNTASEWLLVREGDWVERHYDPRKIVYDDKYFTSLEVSDFERVFAKNYVPLLNN